MRDARSDGTIGAMAGPGANFTSGNGPGPRRAAERWGMAERPIVLVTEPLTAGPLAWLGERATVVLAPADSDEFASCCARAEGLVVRTYTRVDAALLDRMPRLRAVGRAGVGLDNVDAEACAARGVAVLNTPDANTPAVVEFVLAGMLDATRPRGYLDRALDPEAWNALRADMVAPRQLAGSTLGVWGLGRIGARIARAGAALGMEVLYHDLREVPEAEREGARPVPREELLARSDFLTVHVDGRPSNRGLIARAEFALMKPDVVFINTSRGFVVDPEACADFMRARPEAKAMLDVHEPEPIPVEHPLLMMPNVHLTPHIASATLAAKEAMSWVVRGVWEALAAQPV